MIETMKKGFSIGNPTEEEGELARMLCERIDSFEKVKFFCSASEACVGALRIARGYTGKTKVAKMEGGYHGFLDDFHSPHIQMRQKRMTIWNILFHSQSQRAYLPIEQRMLCF